MNAPEPTIRLIMVRESLAGIPEHALPPGFQIRSYQPGDEQHWLRIQTLADRYNVITPALFARQFAGPAGLLESRQFYLLDPDRAVIGTASAWFNDHFRSGRWGRVHWVAIVPDHQGRGLAKPLLGTVCRRLLELGHDRAYLTTSAARLAAVHLYRQFGFEPWVQSGEEAEVWRKLIPGLTTLWPPP